MTHRASEANRLRLTPALEPGEAEFVAGFARRRGSVVRVWPGQPAVPSPWTPCPLGCCLVLTADRCGREAAGQWLRFLLAEFLAGGYRVDGRVEVPGLLGRGPSLFLVDDGEIFEGEM